MNKRKYTFDTSGFSCQNTDCHKYHKVNEGNVRFAYMSGKYKQIAYLKCTACGRCFSENKGTIFFRRKKSKWFNPLKLGRVIFNQSFQLKKELTYLS